MFNNKEIFNTPSGYIGMYLHRGGEYDITTESFTGDTEIIRAEEFHNLIVNRASVFMAKRMAPGKAINDNTGTFLADGLQFLAVGIGVGPGGTTQSPIPAAVTDTSLRQELWRKEFTSWTFVDPGTGADTTQPSNILKLVTTFYEAEANGPLVEMGLFGGDCGTVNSATGQIDAGGSIGHMFNYKTFPVWNKPSDARLTITWKLTF